MRQLNGVYTQDANRRHHLSGHVFQGRYKAILVERDSYLLELSRYIEFVQQGIRSPGVWQHLKGQVFLGGDEFVDAMTKRLQADAKFASQEIPRAQRRALAKALAFYRDEFNDAKSGMAAAYATGDYTQQAIADAFGVHYATVSRAINDR